MSANTGYGPINAIAPFLPDEFQLPQEEKDFKEFYAERERITSSTVNIREIGQYEKQELLTAQTWYSINQNPRKARYVFRKVLDFGALPNNTTKSIAHGITLSPTGFFTNMYAVSKNPAAAPGSEKYIRITFASPTVTDNIAIWCDDTNVYIKSGADWSAWTETNIILEYIKA